MSGAAITVPRRAGLARTQTLVQRPSSIGGCALLAQRAVQLDAQSEKSGNFDAAAAAQAMALYQRACAGLDCLAASGDEVAARGLATYLPRLSELAARLRCRARDVYEEVCVVCFFRFYYFAGVCVCIFADGLFFREEKAR